MKWRQQIICPVVILIFITSCRTKESTSIKEADTVAKKKIEIVLVGHLDFRRTFADIQFMNDDKEIDKYIAMQEQSNPRLTFPVDTFLLDRFEKLNLITKKGIVLKNLKFETAWNFQINHDSGKKIDLYFNFDTSGKHTLIASFLKDSIQIPVRISEMVIGLHYTFLDIIPGGEKELVLLYQWHIMNGDNFDFYVYEIKIH